MARILTMGARCAIGLWAEAAAAAFHADLSNHRLHPFLVDRRGQPVTMSWDDGIADLATGARISALAVAAAGEAVAEPALAGQTIDVMLALPAYRPGFGPDDRAQVAADVRAALAGAVAPGDVLIGQHDHAGGLMAMGAAARRADAPGGRPCLVVAADSLIGPDPLDWIDDAERLMTPVNPFGLIPGEAGAALLVASDADTRRLGIAPRAAIVGHGEAREPADTPPEGPYLGLGLAGAILAATQKAAEARQPVHHLFADLTGEPPRADAFGHALLRTGDRFALADSFDVIAHRTGDTGAAFGPLCAVFTIFGREKGYLGGRLACICGSAPGDARAAVLLDLGDGVSRWV